MPDRACRVVLLVGFMLLGACAEGTSEGPPGEGQPGAGSERHGGQTRAAEESLRSAAEEVARALAEEDFGELAEWADPEKGVLLAPYAYVEPERHVTLSAEEFREVARGETLERTWGTHDGSGEPIRLSFREYLDRFVYDRPYLEEGQVAVGRRQGHGNTLDNTAEVWPEAQIVEYHLPGEDPRYGGMDWRSLRLVFEDDGGGWRLVGIVHDEWTI